MTFVKVEDLFYNVPTRRRAFRSPSEEYAKILDVVGRYAVHSNGVAVSCKKHGDSGVSISTSASSSIVDRIRQIHGSAVANELMSFEADEQKWGCHVSGWASNANYHAKRTSILLFINNRSVESTAVRKAIEQSYSPFLPKGGHPFVYLNLQIEPQRVDVNVHPTKREVNFLNEDEIIESICAAIRTKLAAVDSSRTFMTQTLLPGVRSLNSPSRQEDHPTTNENGRSSVRTPVNSSKRPYENNLVRTDSKMRKITSMLPFRASQAENDTYHPSTDDNAFNYEESERDPIDIRLSSVKNLRSEVRSEIHNNLTEVFASHTYVGVVDEHRRIAAVQAGVKLYLVDYGMICSEYFYQLGLTEFGNFGTINLESSPKLVDLLSLATAMERDEENRRQKSAAENVGDADSIASDSTGPEETAEIDFTIVPTTVAKHLIERREMLNEYFSISISADGCLLSIPLLLKGYMPSLAKLPRFLLRLGPYVDWTNEENCFRTFLRELAAFYTPEQLPAPSSSSKSLQAKDHNASPSESEHEDDSRNNNRNKDQEDEKITRRRSQITWMLEHILFPSIRSRLVATNDLVNGVVEVADLKGLYRVFERC